MTTDTGVQALGQQSWRFAVSGVLGLLVDTAALYLLMFLGLGFALARGLSFVAAATFTWWFNRRYTFGGAAAVPPSWREWGRYLVAMGLGGLVNYGVSLWSHQLFELVRAWPFVALALGSAAGMVFNFFSARYLLFRATR